MDGGLACWGWNRYGQTEAPSGGFSQVSAGWGYSCALRANGGVDCWGSRSVALNFDAAELAVVGWIVARRLANGWIEFGFQPEHGARILPSSRFFPADARVDRWLVSSEVTFDGMVLGRVSARRLADGRIETGFIPAAGERLLPPARYLSRIPHVDSWLDSLLTGDPSLPKSGPGE